ncbi:hypothetical protein GGG16DRAFT_128668 [Schizophyllum commune]
MPGGHDPPNSRASHVNSHAGSTAVSRLKRPDSAAMFNNSALWYNDHIDDELYNQDSLPPQETMFGVSDRPCSQPVREFEPFRHGFDRSPVTQDNRLGEGGDRLGYAQQLPRHAPLYPVSAISQLHDIFPFGHKQYNSTTVQPEHLQYNPAPARTPEHALPTAHNVPFRLEARLSSSDTDTLAPRGTQYAIPDAPNANMYYEPVQAPPYGEHSAGRPTQQAVELARQPGLGAGFGATLDNSTNITSASVSSGDPSAHPMWSMPFEAESSFNDFATQFHAPRLPYLYTQPATVSHPRIDGIVHSP